MVSSVRQHIHACQFRKTYQYPEKGVLGTTLGCLAQALGWSRPGNKSGQDGWVIFARDAVRRKLVRSAGGRPSLSRFQLMWE